MSKYTRRKLIITIFFVSLLIFVFYITNIYDRNKKVENITTVKSIIKNKYDKLSYQNDNNYLYGYYYENNEYNYDVFDLSGNKLYSFASSNLLDVVYVNKKYYIVKDDLYRVYNSNSEELLSSKYVKGINNYILLVDNVIINLDKEIKVENVNDVENIININNGYYYLVDNYLIDEKGNIELEDISSVDEIDSNFITNYIIIKQGDKYYTFFTNLNSVVGSGFDYYYKDKDDLYVYIGYDKYTIYSTGIRKKVSSIDNIDKIKEKYNLDVANIINDKYAFVKNNKDSNYGILNLDSLDYYKVSDNEFEYKKIDNTRVYIKSDKNYIFDLNKNKKIYESDYDLSEIIYYKNDYKVVKNNDKYLLLDDKDKAIKTSNKQIIMHNIDIVYGLINDEVSILIDKELFDGNKANINLKDHVSFEVNGNKKLYNTKTKEEYSSDKYLSYTNYLVAYIENNNLVIKDLVKEKDYNFALKDTSKIINVYMNSFIIEEDNNIIVINKKGKILEEIKDNSVKEIYNNDMNKNIIIITEKEGKEGSYICK